VEILIIFGTALERRGVCACDVSNEPLFIIEVVNELDIRGH
jgi:hypothetical protein